MARKKILGIGAILLSLGLIMSSLTYSFAIEDSEYIDPNAVHTDTFNLEGIKNYVQFKAKVDSSSYELQVNNDCYLYGWNSNTEVFAATRGGGGAEYYNFVRTDLSNSDWVNAFDSQKANPDGQKTLFDFYVKANMEVTESYNVAYYTSSTEDMESFNALGLSDEDKAKYFIPTTYAVLDTTSDSYEFIISKDKYDTLDDATKALYGVQVAEHYSVPNSITKVLSSGANLLYSGYKLDLGTNVSSYMLYDSYKNYIGTFKLSDIPGLYSDSFNDYTAPASITAKASVAGYDGYPYDTAYIDIEYKLGNGGDYITSVVNKDDNSSLTIFGSSLNNAIGVTIYNAVNKDYTLELTTNMGAKATVVAKVTEIGKSPVIEGDDGEPFDGEVKESSAKAPKVTFSGTDKKTTDTYLKIKMNTDIPASMTFNGSTSSGYSTSSDFIVYSNGTYYYSAVGENGKEKTGSIKIDCFVDSISDEEESDKDVDTIFYDSASGVYDESLLPLTGITPTMAIMSVLFIITGITLLIKGGKIDVKKKK